MILSAKKKKKKKSLGPTCIKHSCGSNRPVAQDNELSLAV
jgi:hypothetical protein